MAIKLIAFDLDGTLLTSDKRLTDRTISVLSACADRGIYIVPATGRTWEGIPEEVRALSGVRYAITSNGAAVQDLREGRRIGGSSITWSRAIELMDILEPYPIMYDAYIGGRGKSEARFLDALEDYDLQPELCALVRRTRDCVQSIRSYIEDNRCDVDKINVTFSSRILRTGLRQELRGRLEQEENILVTSSTPFNLELNAPDATKGGGLMFLTEYLELKKEETAAFGDGENDASMIQTAGIGIAMENGAPFLKELADYVTTANDEDGVAAAIEKLVLTD